MEVKIKKQKSGDNSYDLSFKNLTVGKILSMKNALERYTESPVAADVLLFLQRAIDADPELAAEIN